MTRLRTVAVALLSLGLAGCGDGLLTVSGEVTYEGQPVGTGSVTLTPADGKGPIVGGEIRDGKYTVTKVPPGPKIVKIEAYKKVNFASSSAEMMQRAAENKKKGDDSGLVDPADVIPAHAEGNNQQVEVTAGTTRRDFHLSKPGVKKR